MSLGESSAEHDDGFYVDYLTPSTRVHKNGSNYNFDGNDKTDQESRKVGG